MLIKQSGKPLAVRRLDHVRHLVHDDVLQQVLRLFGQLGVEADGAGGGGATSPLGFHALQEVG